MHSFTFNSKTPTRAHIALVLILCAVFCASVELVTSHFFGRVSRIEKRRETEYRAAVAVRSAKTQHKTSVVVAGNSLLLHGIDFPQLQQDVGGEIELHRTVFENTYFLDWYYGFQKMFRAGARPDVMVLVLSPAQLTSDMNDSDYGVHMLVDPHDIIRFAKDMHTDRNRMSVLVLDNFSFFFGARAEIRTWILGKILPDLPLLTSSFGRYYKFAPPDKNTVLEVSAKRLQQLRNLCGQYGTEFVLVVPPTLQDSGTSEVLEAGASQGVPVLIPLRPGVLSSENYSDEVHLNSQGAGEFTLALASNLKKVMAQNAIQTETASVLPEHPANRPLHKTAIDVVQPNAPTTAALISK